MAPPHDGIVSDRFHEFFFTLFVIILTEFLCKIKIVPTYKGIFDEPATAFRNVLVFFFILREGMIITQ